jgi:hypothetical protein
VIAALRRLRWLPAFLTLLSPGVGGDVLPLLHPCPVEQPWLATETAGEAAESQAGDHAHHGDDTPAGDRSAPSHDHGDTGSCSCLGSCHAPGLVAVPRAPVLDVAVESTAPDTRRWWSVERAGAPRLAELLPPKTAPPIA